MKFSPEDFSASRDTVQRLYKKVGLEKTLEACVCSGIHLVAALSFILEVEKEPKKSTVTQKYLQELLKFYDLELE